MFTAFQVCRRRFCLFLRQTPFEKDMFLTVLVFVCQYLVNISQYLSILINPADRQKTLSNPPFRFKHALALSEAVQFAHVRGGGVLI